MVRVLLIFAVPDVFLSKVSVLMVLAPDANAIVPKAPLPEMLRIDDELPDSVPLIRVVVPDNVRVWLLKISVPCARLEPLKHAVMAKTKRIFMVKPI